MSESASTKPAKRRGWLLPLIGICVGLCLVCGVVSRLGGSKSREGGSAGNASSGQVSATRTPRPTKAPTATLTPLPLSDLNFLEMRELARGATNAQKDVLFKQWRGQRVRWTGWIDEVKKDGEVRIDMDPPEEISVSDVVIRIPKEDALKYNIDQKVEFDGVIRDISEILGSYTFTLQETYIVSPS